MEKNTKTLLSVGSLLILLALVPGISWVSIVGIVLFLIGIHQLSQAVKDNDLFSETLWAFLIPVIGGAILALVIGIFTVIFAGSVVGLAGTMEMSNFDVDKFSPFALFSVGGGVVILLVAVAAILGWVLAIIYGTKMQKVSISLENHLQNANFKTAGSLFFWGGWLSIILVGAILIWVGWLLYTIGFFSVSEKSA